MRAVAVAAPREGRGGADDRHAAPRARRRRALMAKREATAAEARR